MPQEKMQLLNGLWCMEQKVMSFWYVVDDPENPIAVVEGEFIDGCSVELEVEEDTNINS